MLKLNHYSFLSLMHIEPGEAGRFLLTCLFVFCIGVNQSYLCSVPLALLLADHSSAVLPYVYIGSSILTLLFGLLYSLFEKRISFLPLMSAVLILSAATLFAFWLLPHLLSKTTSISLPFIVAAWAIFNFDIMAVGSLLNQLFTLQQGKRLFGLVMGVQGLGGILAGLSLPVLSHVVAINTFILIAAVFLLLAFGFLVIIHEKYTAAFVTIKKASIPKKNSIVKKIPKNPYVSAIYWLVALTFFDYYVLNILLNTVVQQHYPDSVALENFFGTFYAAKDLLKLLISVFTYRWLLKKWGVVEVLALPSLIFMGLMVAALIANFIPPLVGMVFGLIVLTQLLDETLLGSLIDKSRLLLIQPLKVHERTAVLTKINITVIPLASIVIGFILLLVSKSIGIHLVEMGPALVVIYMLEVVLLFFMIKPAYLKALLDALSKHRMVNPDFNYGDKNTVALLEQSVQSAYPEEVIYALSMLEKISMDAFLANLSVGLNSPQIDVRLFALEKIRSYRYHLACPPLKALLAIETNDNLFSEELLTLAAVGDKDSLALLAEYVEDKNELKRSAAIRGLWIYGTEVYRLLAEKYLDQLIKSTAAQDKIAGAQILQHIDYHSKIETLRTLLSDPDLAVRSAACLACKGLSNPVLYPGLIDNLQHLGSHRHAFTSLVTQGDSLVEYVETEFENFSLLLQCEIMQILGVLTGNAALPILLGHLSAQDTQLRQAVLEALEKKRFRATTAAEAQLIKERLLAEVEQAKYLYDLLLLTPRNTYEALLYSFMARELTLARDRIFALLSFTYPADVIATARKGFRAKGDEMTSYAIEALLRVLTQDHRQSLIFVFEFRPHSLVEAPIDTVSRENISVWLRAILKMEDKYYIHSMAALVSYVIGGMKIQQFDQLLQEQHASTIQVVRETSAWAVKQLR